MKKVVFVEDDESCKLPESYLRDKIVVMSGLSKFLGGSKKDLDITSYDLVGDICWSVWTIRKIYNVFDTKTNSFLEIKTKQEFLDKVIEQYPEDFEFFIWNPEIFNGEYLESND
jgi:hypothetical protein